MQNKLNSMGTLTVFREERVMSFPRVSKDGALQTEHTAASL